MLDQENIFPDPAWDKRPYLTSNRSEQNPENREGCNITPAGRKQTETHITSVDNQLQSRWKDDYAAQRSQTIIFDLIDSENVDARRIADAARAGQIENVKTLACNLSPIQQMNDILSMANFDFQILVDMGSTLTAVRDALPPYSIAELSDGERNALLIIANVLTVPENTLILLDEPERHLHRSIVSPLLSTLLTYRDDCAFIIYLHMMFHYHTIRKRHHRCCSGPTRIHLDVG